MTNSLAIIPELGIASLRMKKASGAVRLWMLARDEDKAGAGNVRAADLRSIALGLGVKARTFEYWLLCARELKMLYPVRDGAVLAVSSVAKVAETMLVSRIGRKVEIRKSALFSKGWKSVVWAAYIKSHFDGQQVSDKTLMDLTNIPIRTQHALNKYVRRKQQIGISSLQAAPGTVDAVRHYTSHHSAFRFYDRGADVVAWNISNKRSVSDKVAKTAALGRARKVNKQLQARNHLPSSESHYQDVRRAMHAKARRLYFHPLVKAKRTTASHADKHDRLLAQIVQRQLLKARDPKTVKRVARDRRRKRDAKILEKYRPSEYYLYRRPGLWNYVAE